MAKKMTVKKAKSYFAKKKKDLLTPGDKLDMNKKKATRKGKKR